MVVISSSHCEYNTFLHFLFLMRCSVLLCLFKVGSCNDWQLRVIKVVNVEKTNGLIVYNLLVFSRFTAINELCLQGCDSC